ncbi:MAG: hypothetical protein Q7N50_04345, partial [Armatimonadota bacterium]|nr:hypothetical protein [Armatimonadota bacterium]
MKNNYVMEFAIILAISLAVAVPVGAQSKWPESWQQDVVKHLDKVVAPSKSCPELSMLFASPYDRPLHRSQVIKFLRSKALDGGGYIVIDEITRREAALDKARASASSSKMETVYHSLRLRTRLALSFGRTAVAKQ